MIDSVEVMKRKKFICFYSSIPLANQYYDESDQIRLVGEPCFKPSVSFLVLTLNLIDLVNAKN